MGQPPPTCQVYGINILVKLLSEAPPGVRLYCPKGSPIRYGVVVGRGDGFDEGANTFREMPPIEAVVAFEETAEDDEFRVLRLDSVILAFPRE
jgi:hypothetical protein